MGRTSGRKPGVESSKVKKSSSVKAAATASKTPRPSAEDEFADLISEEPIGKDCPLKAADRKPSKCTILVSDVSSINLLTQDFKCRLDDFSQNPTVVVAQSVGEGFGDAARSFFIGTEQMNIVDQDVEKTVLTFSLEKDAIDTLAARLVADLNMPALSAEQLKALEDTYKNGVDVLSFQTVVNDEDPVPVVSPRGHPLPAVHELRTLCDEVRKGQRVTILRPANARRRNVIDKLWLHRLGPVFQKGIYPHFEPLALIGEPGKEEENLELYFKGVKLLPVLPWLRKPQEEGVEVDGNEMQRFGNLPGRPSCTSRKEAYIVKALSLISEVQYQRAIFKKVFDNATAHEVKALPHPKHPKMWNIGVYIQSSKEYTVPSVPDGSKFRVKFTNADTEMGDAEPASTDAHLNQVLKMETIEERDDKLSEAAFVMEWKELRGMDTPFQADGVRDVTLEMDENLEPARRQLDGLKRMLRVSRLKNGNLRDWFVGHNYDTYDKKAPLADNVDRLEEDELVEVAAFLDTVQMNYLQWQGFDLPFFSEAGAVSLQGPPGTGKSLVISRACTTANLLGVPVLACGPSKASVRAIALKIVPLLQDLESYPLLSQKVKLTLYRKNSDSEGLALALLGQIEKPNWDDEEKLLLPCQYFSRAIEYGRQKFLAGQGEDSDANWSKHVDWYNKLLAMENGAVLSLHDWNFWWKWLDGPLGTLVIDHETTMLLSTCNNSGKIEAISNFWTKLKDGIVIVDEAAFDQEYSAWTPLSREHYQSFLVGDHCQLEPIYGCEHASCFGATGKLSLFKRTVDLEGTELVSLKITYRLHARLADLVGAVSYGGLVSEHSQAPSQTWTNYSSWFGHSKYEQLRRDPPARDAARKTFAPGHKLLAKADDKFRRAFINVRGSSGKPEGSMSTVNYANVNAILDFVQAFLLSHSDEEENITIVVPFAAQKKVIEKQLKLQYPHLKIKVRTIDSFQGGENGIVLLCLTSANRIDPAFIGFLDNWNRLLVAITRSQQALVAFGNLDLWRTRSQWMKNKHPAFAKFTLDFVDRGDVIDLDIAVETLPKDESELAKGHAFWSLSQPPAAPREYQGEDQPLPIRDAATAGKTDTFSAAEGIVITELDIERSKADKGRVAVQVGMKENAGMVSKLVKRVEERHAAVRSEAEAAEAKKAEEMAEQEQILAQIEAEGPMDLAE